MRIHKRRIAWVAALAGVLLCVACALQFAFWNVGQEFGAYGQYHRVLRVARSMNEFVVVRHRVRRKLELGSLSHVEEFSLQLRDRSGHAGTVVFRKATADMAEKDEDILRATIRRKFQEDVAKEPR